MTIEVMYRCTGCDDVYSDEEEAINCCQPGVNDVFVCPSCHGLLNTEAEAVACCDKSTTTSKEAV